MRPPTPRQVEIAQGLADNLPMREVAVRLGISVHTARTHAEAYRRRVGAKHMPAAIAAGFRGGWLA